MLARPAAGPSPGSGPSRPRAAELVPDRLDLAGNDVDRGDEGREVAVADDDPVLTLGERELGERRRDPGGGAVDLDVAPGADRDPYRAGRGDRGLGGGEA